MALTSPLAIYVHWPWCKAKCPYCDFNSHASAIQEEAYVAGILAELHDWKVRLGADGTRPLVSVFFGGGTPSLMQPENVAKIIAACAEIGTFSRETEVTVECNPTSFDDTRPATGLFKDLRAAGVNRVSVGIQGLKPEWLRFLGRSHAVEDALNTLDAAQAVFENVNADVIYGLPDQALADWTEQLERLASRGLQHISAYQLTVEPNTRFHSDVKRGLWRPVDEDTEADFFEATQGVLGRLGYENYEVSNFAKPGKACQHNRHVWEYGDYIGVGAGAHGRVTLPEGERVATVVVRQPEGYLKRHQAGLSMFASEIAVDGVTAIQEALFLGLRLQTGVKTDHLIKLHGKAAYAAAVNEGEEAFLRKSGLLKNAGGRMRVSAEGWTRLNAVLNRLLTPLPTPTPSGGVVIEGLEEV